MHSLTTILPSGCRSVHAECMPRGTGEKGWGGRLGEPVHIHSLSSYDKVRQVLSQQTPLP